VVTGTDEKIRAAIEHQRSGQVEQAEGLYRSVLENEPANAAALHGLGVAAYKRGQYEQAYELIGKAVAGNTQSAELQNSLGSVYKALGRIDEAEAAYERAVELSPDCADAYYNLGNCLAARGQYEDALTQYEKALGLKPDDAFVHYNMGVALQKLGRHEEAIASYGEVIRLNHDPVAAYEAMASSEQSLGRYDEALNCLRRALEHEPDCARIHTQLGMFLLQAGDFEQGWREYSQRLRDTSWAKSYAGVPMWDGSRFGGKRLLIRCEQGLGDNIQFARYVPMVKERGGTVILGMYKQLFELMKSVEGADEVIASNKSVQIDMFVPLLELPRIFGTRLETVPGRVPYLHADPAKVEYWRARLAGEGFKVGIAWGTSEADINSYRRRCELRHFAKLGEIRGVRLYGLQKGATTEQLKGLPYNIAIINLGDEFEDFSDTAAAVENMDLVISVDTSVLHLAGAMGKAVWAALLHVPDWRWMAGRDESPWYPTMRLFRQPQIGQWEAVFERMAGELRLPVEERNASERQETGDKRQETEDRRQKTERPGQDHGPQTVQSVLPSGKSGQTISNLSSSPAQSRPQPTESSHKRSPDQTDSSDAMHNLALAAYQKGRYEQAVDLVKKAIAANPQGAQFHNTLGLALEALGRYEQALASYERAVTLRQDYSEAYNNMAISLTSQGKYAEAEEKARKAIELKADYAQAYNSLGYAQMQLAASDRGKSEQAAGSYRRAIALKPDFAEAHNHLGVVLAAEGRWVEAIGSYRAALRLEPGYAEAYNNMGVALREQGEWSGAIESYRKAIELESDFAEAHYNLANALRELGQLEEAIRHYERAIRIRSDYAAAHWNYSLALLLAGRLAEGWKEYAWRWKDSGRVTMYPHRHDKARWDGSSFEGKRLLVHYEQGFGDTIQFVRYLPMVKARGGAVILEERKPLIELLGQLDCVDEFIVTSVKNAPAVGYDFHVSLMDLPEIFGTTLETIPASVPYLRADLRKVEYWRGRLSKGDFKVGIVWAGSATYGNDRQRSCPLELFKPVSQVPGVRLYGLQKDLAALQADVLFDKMGLINLADEFDNFADTAAVIENMDLVISVDTSVAHLAGAMGKAIWTLLPFSPDWRWMLNREDSAWYPTMRLFRQDERGEWQSVFARVAESLQGCVRAGR
jgi:tetratricopeptide (TPR) repeat protein